MPAPGSPDFRRREALEARQRRRHRRRGEGSGRRACLDDSRRLPAAAARRGGSRPHRGRAGIDTRASRGRWACTPSASCGRALATTARIARAGWPSSASAARCGSMTAPLAEPMREYHVSEERWDSAIARRLARESVADVAGPAPIARVDPRAHARTAWSLPRRPGGAVAALGRRLFFDRRRIQAKVRCTGSGKATIVWPPSWPTPPAQAAAAQNRAARVRQSRDGRLTVSTRGDLPASRRATSTTSSSRCPPSVMRDVTFDPELPDAQRDAFTPAPARRRALVSDTGGEPILGDVRGRPRAFGTDQPYGAVWDANEQQRGQAAVLSFLAGGRASIELQDIVRDEGLANVLRARRLAPARKARRRRAFSSRGTVVWENDPGRAAAMRSSTPASIRSSATGSHVRPGASSLPANTPATAGRATSTARSTAAGARQPKWLRFTTNMEPEMRKPLPSSFEEELTRVIERWLPALPDDRSRRVRSAISAPSATEHDRQLDVIATATMRGYANNIRDEITGLVRRKYCLDYLRGLLSRAPATGLPGARRHPPRPGRLQTDQRHLWPRRRRSRAGGRSAAS